MTTTWRYRFLIFNLAALVLLAASSGVAKEIRGIFDDNSLEALGDQILNRQISIVPQLNKLNFGLGRYDGESFYYKKSLSKIFFSGSYH